MSPGYHPIIAADITRLIVRTLCTRYRPDITVRISPDIFARMSPDIVWILLKDITRYIYRPDIARISHDTVRVSSDIARISPDIISGRKSPDIRDVEPDIITWYLEPELPTDFHPTPYTCIACGRTYSNNGNE